MAIRKMNNGLTEATKGVLNMTDDFVNQMIGAEFDLKTIEGVEAQDLKMMQDTVKLYNNYKALILLTAKKQDEMYNLLNELIDKVDKLEKAK